MIYADRNGNRTEKTTGQDRFLEYIYGHTLTRMMLKPLLGSRTSRLGGKVLDSRVSRLLIPSFVRRIRLICQSMKRNIILLIMTFLRVRF